MTFVKICGNRTVSDVAAASGADALGVVVASPKSRRNVSEEEARRLLSAARPFQMRVAVTAATDPATLLRLAVFADAVQCPAAAAHAVAGIRAAFPHVRFLLAARPEEWAAAAPAADVVLLDALGADGYGGTGKRLDEEAARSVVKASPKPVALAGGLTPTNVAAAIRSVRPFAVDVSSGVETDGVKDPDRVRAFVRAARSALDPGPPRGGLV